MRLAVIRNPKSGRGSGAEQWRNVEETLRQHFPDLHVELTTGHDSARVQARTLAEQGFDIIAAAGGDGTISMVMKGLLHTKATLAVLPFGTGNDFSRTLGFGTDSMRAANSIVTGTRQLVDVGKLRIDDKESYFLNVAGCGFDAEVARRVNEGFGFLRGRSAYLAAILQALATYKPTHLTLCIDGETLETSAMLVAIANAKCYGGGMMVAPTAEITDGLLDLVIVQDLPKIEFLRCFPSVFSGKHLSHPRVIHRRFRTLQIRAGTPALYLSDGELLPPGDLAVEVLPATLRLIVES